MSATTPPSGGGTVGQTTDAAKDSGREVASDAADKARDVAGTAQEQAGQVVGEAKTQARNVLGEARTQVQNEADNRRQQAVSSLRQLGDELGSMTSHDGDKGLATDLAQRGQRYVQQSADWLESRQPSDVLDDLKRFARRRPGAFLLGALVAGIVAGRLTRATVAGPPEQDSGRDLYGSSGYAGPSASRQLPPAGGDVAPFASSQGTGLVGGEGDPSMPTTGELTPDYGTTDDMTTPLPTAPGQIR